MKWRDDLYRLTRGLNVPGIDVVAKDPSEWELAADADEVIIKARLDPVYGEFRLSGRELRSGATATTDVLQQHAVRLRNKMRGLALVDILNDEWSAPASIDEQLLQRMERAALRLMAFVDKHREEM